jgi:antitoxin ParD1/3/4
MGNTESLSITLPHELARMIRDKIDSGAYANESEVIQDGLRALQTRDAVVERWLLDAVVPVYDRVASGEEKLLDVDEVVSGLLSRYQARKAKSVR